ncbi:hypothetical protein ACSHWH_04055 [Leucobacter sp. W1478]
MHLGVLVAGLFELLILRLDGIAGVFVKLFKFFGAEVERLGRLLRARSTATDKACLQISGGVLSRRYRNELLGVLSRSNLRV